MRQEGRQSLQGPEVLPQARRRFRVRRDAQRSAQPVPSAGGEVNGDRLNHPFATVEGEPRRYGSCDFEVGGSPKAAEPADAVRGELARAMLYMADQYGVDVRMSREALLAWHESDPPAAWEIERAQRIEAATGLENPHIGAP